MEEREDIIDKLESGMQRHQIDKVTFADQHKAMIQLLGDGLAANTKKYIDRKIDTDKFVEYILGSVVTAMVYGLLEGLEVTDARSRSKDS